MFLSSCFQLRWNLMIHLSDGFSTFGQTQLSPSRRTTEVNPLSFCCQKITWSRTYVVPLPFHCHFQENLPCYNLWWSLGRRHYLVRNKSCTTFCIMTALAQSIIWAQKSHPAYTLQRERCQHNQIWLDQHEGLHASRISSNHNWDATSWQFCCVWMELLCRTAALFTNLVLIKSSVPGCTGKDCKNMYSYCIAECYPLKKTLQKVSFDVQFCSQKEKKNNDQRKRQAEEQNTWKYTRNSFFGKSINVPAKKKSECLWKHYFFETKMRGSQSVREKENRKGNYIVALAW